MSATDRGTDLPSPLRILLAEDNLINQKVASLTLSRLGYTAEIARDGVEAVEAARNTDFDLILMDMQMPRMAGVAAAMEIRAIRPNPNRPYIVAMTASARLEDRTACLEAGMNDFITKPIRESRLRELFKLVEEKIESENDDCVEMLTS